MTPSETTAITSRQIAKFLDLQTAALRKSGLSSAETQQVLERQGGSIADEFVMSVRKRVEAVSKMIVRHVKINRAQKPQEALDATGCKQYTDREVVDAMPCGKVEEVDLYFFEPRPEAYQNGVLTDEALAKEYEFHRLEPHPRALIQANKDDTTLAKTRPNGCHWKDASGKWCYVAFSCLGGVERDVLVDRDVSGWIECWSFAGARK